MEEIKRAFEKVKEENDILSFKINSLKEDISLLKEGFFEIFNVLDFFKKELNDFKINLKDLKTQFSNFSTDRQLNQTDLSLFKPLKDKNKGISIGNKGVSTDKQTNRQTNRQIENTLNKPSFNNAKELVNSLDNFQKELRLKFKSLTDQEMFVFSAIYQLDEEKGFSDYKSLSQMLNLSESSIRDYVRRLISKEIPLEKKKINNKEIQITLSSEFKKIASLNTLLELRGL